METVAGSQLVAESFTLRQSTPLSLSQQRGVRGLTNQGGKIPLGTEIKPLWRKLGDKGKEALTLLGIGRIYDALGEKKQALDYFQQALY